MVKTKVTRRVKIAACMGMCLLLAAVGKAILGHSPRAVISLAVDDAGTMMAVSYIESGFIPNYDRIHTCVIKIDADGLRVVETFTPPPDKAVTSDIADRDRVLLASPSGLYVHSKPDITQLVDSSTRTIGARFANDVIIMWSRQQLSVASIGNSEAKWQLPLQDGQRILAANWAEEPLRISVVKGSFEHRPGQGLILKSCLVEIWEPHHEMPAQSWPIAASSDRIGTVAVNRSGDHVVAYSRMMGGKRNRHSLVVCNSSDNTECVQIDDPPNFICDDLLEDFKFIDDVHCLLVDAAGRIVLVDALRASCDVVPRIGQPQDLIDATTDGSVVVMAGRLQPNFEIWRRDTSGMKEWIVVNIETGLPRKGQIKGVRRR